MYLMQPIWPLPTAVNYSFLHDDPFGVSSFSLPLCVLYLYNRLYWQIGSRLYSRFIGDEGHFISLNQATSSYSVFSIHPLLPCGETRG